MLRRTPNEKIKNRRKWNLEAEAKIMQLNKEDTQRTSLNGKLGSLRNPRWKRQQAVAKQKVNKQNTQ